MVTFQSVSCPNASGLSSPSPPLSISTGISTTKIYIYIYNMLTMSARMTDGSARPK